MTWHSDSINEVCAALADARGEIKLIHHNAKMVVAKAAPKVGYATLDQLIENTVDPLAKHGLSISTGHDIHEGRLWIVAKLMHKSGQWISEGVVVPESRGNDRDHWGNITSGRRYALMALLNLSVAGEDDAAARPTTLNQKQEEKPEDTNGGGDPPKPKMSIADKYLAAKDKINGLGGAEWDDAKMAAFLGKPIKDIDDKDINKLRGLYAKIREELKSKETENA